MNEPILRSIRGGAHAPVRHDSAVGHLTGRALYIDDLPVVPGTLHAALVLSPHPHARISRIDLARALASPGVVAAIVANDIPGKNDIGPIRPDEPLLPREVVEYEGQPVVAVAADTLDNAREAAKLVAIDYEILPAVLSLSEAVARELYVSPVQTMKRGDVDAELARAPHRLSGEFACGGQDHFYLEGQVALAVPGEGTDMAVYSSTQHPTEVQHGVAHLLGLPFNMVTVEVRRMGGGFGGKESQATLIAGIAAVLARKAGRPVKLRLPRDDDMRATGKRHPFLFRYDIGFDGDGRILGLDLMLAANGGNVADHTPAVVTRALCHADNCYWLPSLRFTGLPCKTNTVSNTAFRGYGGPQGMFAIETILDIVARHLGLPLEELRRRNFYGIGRNDVTPYSMKVEDNILTHVTDELEQSVDLAGWREEISAFNRTSPVIKKGLATLPIKFGISFNRPALNQAGALVSVYTDGSVTLNHGGTEMGQGLFIKVAQVVAEAFQVDLENIRVSATTTGKVPNTSPTAASCGSDLNGMAALNAAQEIKGRMTDIAAKHFDVPPNDILFAANRIYAGNRSVSFSELALLCWDQRVSLSATGYYRTPKINWDPKTNTGRPFYYFVYGAAASEVAIDTLTGEMRVLRAELLQDCGKSLNPALDLGQIEGAFVQGMGWLTTEELWWDESGRLKTHGPSTYKIPGSRDVPPRFNVRLLSDAPNKEATVFRSKAVGEPPLMLAISVWLAVRDAIASLADYKLSPVLDAPTTPERILSAIDDILSRAAH
ncbi:xanthine dehydrogenase molybdopterin binding subunit [Bradyrhizobium erythrophlei]|jgi:xanthine dehydrogenase large subunit|uniref:Xanthine dehydrogenase, molybdenum binding subunit apoprotein n=1 Tax=Bradyrhizobium erythrophlei TaxID=1437360 RepID=A0A1M7UW75_9BRAD|nr:xanthine dehydrogenase molybdopterin binding subunit [Bradyrhizobium erythrophlei]SHN87233.1 xanthine dehydrogenase, molybdenum binding subunit apoprotein [Bradyrhizobium erythrophlei]